ncbi:hypothetical protein ACMX2H_11520 [Arthrobacter sulfonylureivorans]|uniref:hypothetical protein n=1 Tax=Arthrobacter sulfonylureivorans TaxID=2486855 RepID=UPI0039E6BAA2
MKVEKAQASEAIAADAARDALMAAVSRMPSALVQEWAASVLPALNGPLALEHAEEFSQALESMYRMQASIASLGPAVAALENPVMPSIAAAVQATENLWREISRDWGLFPGSDVAVLLGGSKSNRGLAASLRKGGKIIGVQRGQAFVYPGFQFDRTAGKVLPVIPELISAAAELGLDNEDLVYWLMAPSGYFEDDRPVDHLGDSDLVAKLRNSESVEW